MKRIKVRSTIAVILTIAMVLSSALPVIAQTPSPPVQTAAEAAAASSNGEFVISVKTATGWVEAGRLSCNMFLKEKCLDLSGIIPDSGPAAVRITQEGGEAAHLDSVFLGGSTPETVNCDDEFLLGKLSKKDLDLINVEAEGVELVFPAERTGTVLAVTGRIEGERISQEPFNFPNENDFRPVDKSSKFFTYKLDSIIKSLDVDGEIQEIDGMKPFFKEYCVPATGHPEGYTYGWVMNDEEYLYAVIDFTPDNTMDGDKDYSKLYIKSGDEVTEYKISVPETEWGIPGFTYTDKVGYQHKVYEYKIPLDAVKCKADGSIPLSFSAYGTAGNYTLLHPAIAYNTDSNRYFVIYEGNQYGHNLYGRFAGENAEWLDNPSPILINDEPYSEVANRVSSNFPEVAYDSINNRFLVVWKSYPYEGNPCIMGQLFDGNGSKIGNNFIISNSPSSTWNQPISIAFSTTDEEYLVVWSGTSNDDILGRLINKDGAVVGTEDIEICTSDYSEVSPSVEYSPSDNAFLVVWEDMRNFVAEGTDIYGCIVKGANVVDGSNTLFNSYINENTGVEQRCPSITYDSNEKKFLVVWSDSRNNSVERADALFGRYVHYDGASEELVMAEEKEIFQENEIYTHSISVEYNNGMVLSAWAAYNNTYGILSESGALTPIEPRITLGSDDEYQANPAAAANTNWGNYVVAYSNVADYSDDPQVMLKLIGESAEYEPKESIHPSVAYDPNPLQNKYLLVYSNQEYYTPRIQSLEAEENPTGSTSYFSRSGIVGQFVSNTAEAIKTPFLISDLIGEDHLPAMVDYPEVAYGGNKFLVAWLESDYETSRILGNFIGENGQSLTGGSFEIAGGLPGYWEEKVGLAYADNDKFLVVWSQDDDILGCTIYLNDASEEPVISDPVDICMNSGVQSNPSAAYSTEDEKFLVVWDDDRNYSEEDQNPGWNLYGRLLDKNGQIEDPNSEDISVCTAAEDQRGPSVVYNSESNKFFVTWYEIDSNYNEYSDAILGTYLEIDESTANEPAKLIIDQPGDVGSQEYRNLSTVYNPVWNEYFSVWSVLDYYEYDTWGMGQCVTTELDADGGRYNFGRYIYNEADEQLDIACNTNEGNYLVAYPCLNNLAARALEYQDNEYGGYITWELIGRAAPELPTFSFYNTPYTVAENIYEEAGIDYKEIEVLLSMPDEYEPVSLLQEDISVVASVYYETSEGTANIGEDYEDAQGILEFIHEDYDEEVGGYIKSFPVQIIDNDEPDDMLNETVTLTLYDPSEGAELITDPCTATLTIVDDDETSLPPPPPSSHRSSGGSSTYTPPPVIESPPPTEGLPNDALVDRMPGYIALSTPTKITEVKNEISLSFDKSLLAKNPKHAARIYYWRPEVKKWVALATYPDGDGRVKAVNDGGYKGWFVVFGVIQPQFSDVANHWAEQLINRMNGLGLIEGYFVKDSEIRVAKPQQSVTRAEFTMFVARIMNMNPDNILLPAIDESEVESILSRSYKDQEQIPSWVRAAVAKAIKAELVPFKGSEFKPFEPITRIEAAVMVSRALRKFRDFKSMDLTSFKDSGEIPGWAVGQVVEGAVEGTPENTMKPNDNLERAQAIAMLMRLFIKGLGW